MFLLAFIMIMGNLHCALSCKARPQHNYNVVLLGAQGSGKSTLGNSLLGYQGYNVHPRSNGNGCLEAGSESTTSSHTKEPCKVDGNLFYYNELAINVIDTPGFEADGARNMMNIDKTAKYLMSKVGQVKVFVVLLKYTDFEWDLVKYALTIYELVFGPEFWDHVVFVVNFNPAYTMHSKHAQDYWRREVLSKISGNRAVPIMFANAPDKTSELQKRIQPLLTILHNKPTMKVQNMRELVKEIDQLKKKVSNATTETTRPEAALSTTTVRPVTTLSKTTHRPLLCGGNHPVVIKGVTLYPDTVIYTFHHLIYSGLIGFGAALLLLGFMVLVLQVCCSRKETNDNKHMLPKISPMRSSKMSANTVSMVLDNIGEDETEMDLLKTKLPTEKAIFNEEKPDEHLKEILISQPMSNEDTVSMCPSFAFSDVNMFNQ